MIKLRLRGGAMNYKLYFLDHNDRVAHRVDLECEDDASAESAIARHGDGRAMELWQGGRFLAHFPARAKASSLPG